MLFRSDQLRAAIVDVTNATFQARLQHIWGDVTTTCASDSTQFAAFYLESMVVSQVSHSGLSVFIFSSVWRSKAYFRIIQNNTSRKGSLIIGK